MLRQPEASHGGSLTGNEFSREERAWLLALAHDSISSVLQGQTFSPEPLSAHLSERRGAFTTLYVDGELHGCVGYALGQSPLFRTILETARAAAFEDPRFPPVTLSDLPHLEVSLSVLSGLFPIAPEQVEVGRHGLLITDGPRRGLLLPQVAIEHGWDRETFLRHTCHKAGLPADAWRRGATIHAFTAEIFGDRDLA